MVTKRIKVYGIVQGVGMRPTVARHAASLGIKGSVSNLGPYVEIYAQGEDQNVGRFIDLIKNEPPKRAAILKMDVKEKDVPEYKDFSIIESAKTSGEIFVSPDIAIAMSAFPNSLTGITGDICTRSSTAHAAGLGLRSWMRFLMTAREHR